MKFEQLKIIKPILKALAAEGYNNPTPIQEKTIPSILDGKDLLGCAQTGTGKTAAFAIPVLQNLYLDNDNNRGQRTIKALILTPTRELAIQIGESFSSFERYTGLKHTTIFGGVSQISQINALKAGVDILIATPGRLLDLTNQRYIKLSNVKMFVLDEADRMLDMGFLNDVKKIIMQLPHKKQTLLFSATMPAEISKLVNDLLCDPVKVKVAPVSSTADIINQEVYFVDQKDKKSLLIQLLKDKSIDSALVFTRTKYEADKVATDLEKARITAKAIHGNKSQIARQVALNSFKSKKTRVLVATDIAARGIDISKLTHVINFDLPNVPETYVHRIGRTGRAGNAGIAVSFCNRDETKYLNDIQKLISKKIPVVENLQYAKNL